MSNPMEETPALGVLSLYVLEGCVVCIGVTRALATHGNGLALAGAVTAAVVLALWAGGWPTYARARQLAADAAQRAAHPGSHFKGTVAPPGPLFGLARVTVGAIFAMHAAVYRKTSLAFRPPLALVWLALGAAGIAFLPNRAAPLAKPSVVVDETPIAPAGPEKDDRYACPAGTEKKGAAPPDGRELWCEKAGKKNGPAWRWHDDASERLALQGSYKDGERDGMWKSWYSSGREQNEGAFKDGKPDGHHLAWDENGKKILDVTYADGAEVK